MRILLFLSLWSLSLIPVSGQTDFYTQLADSAEVLTKQTVHYDPSYFKLDYPNGDVPASKGVCTDVVIRAYRKLDLLQDPKTYLPGDLVCWNLGGGITHIGIVSNRKAADGKRHLMVHNIGAGQVLEDCLFSFKVIGHYRYGM
ncbi:MAG: DUF1287 domain-containing protein [Flavobacteriales bacterium]|nr:DUF1287 domain-containing protein [Flavobacteriales bacterium]